MHEFQINHLETILNLTHIINIAYYKFPKSYQFPGESHDFWEFVYVDKGKLIIRSEDTQYILKAGEMAFHKPGEFHSIYACGDIPGNAIIISFICSGKEMNYYTNKILFLDKFEKQCLKTAVHESELTYEEIEKAPPAIYMQKKADAPFGSDQLIKTSLEQLLINIQRRGDSISLKQRRTKINQNHSCEAITAKIEQYIEEHYAERITLPSISAHVNISISQVKKIFKIQTGETIITHLTAMRISEAKRLIQESTLNFTQIAESVGYESIYYFSKTFKQKTGMTLTEYSQSLKM